MIEYWISEIKKYLSGGFNFELAAISFHYVFFFICLIIVFIYQVRKRPFECVAYIFPCLINIFSLGLVNTARYSIGTGIFVLGFISLLSKSPKWIKILSFFVLFGSTIGLQIAWFNGHQITIG